MELLISLYDNFLIYYPNIFFPLFLLFVILGVILLVKGAIFLNREFTKISKEVKINLRKIKITRKARINFSPSKFTKSVFYIVKAISNFYTKVNNSLKRCILQVEKIIVRIKKEIVID